MFWWYSGGGWLALKFPPPVAPCGNLWLLWIHALLHSNLQEVAPSNLITFTIKFWFWKLPESAANQLLMVWNLYKVAVKQFTRFYNEIWMVLEASGICCESIIDGLESRGGCCESISALLHWNINGFWNFRRLLRVQYWWYGISKRLLWSHLRTFTIEYLWFWKLPEAAVNPLFMVWNLEQVAV